MNAERGRTVEPCGPGAAMGSQERGPEVDTAIATAPDVERAVKGRLGGPPTYRSELLGSAMGVAHEMLETKKGNTS